MTDEQNNLTVQHTAEDPDEIIVATDDSAIEGKLEEVVPTPDGTDTAREGMGD